MPPEPIPRDPVYMSYITRHHQEVRQPSPQRTPPGGAFRPASGLTYTDLQLQTSRSTYPHFHRPFNDYTRNLAVASTADRAVFRDLPRRSPAPWDGSIPPEYDPAGPRQRPASAPSAARHTSASPPPNLRGLDLRGLTLTDNMVTATGRPCYTLTTTLEADVEAGVPVVEAPLESDERDWRLRRVQTYQVPPSVVGYGSGGVRPFHQDYRHYKYFGFGGKGAKTSWAHNPKYSRMYGDLLPGPSPLDPGAPPLSFQDPVAAPPLQLAVGGARRRLTPAERALVQQFGGHNYASEGVPSDPRVTRQLAHAASGARPAIATRVTSRYLQKRPQDSTPYAVQGEVIEPYRTRVDLDRRHAVTAAAARAASPGGPNPTTTAAGIHSPPSTSPAAAAAMAAAVKAVNAARVTTYRQMSSPYAGELNRSPNHGSLSPWHQRYGHYKYAGFAGRGATSSWARNPKYAFMYD